MSSVLSAIAGPIIGGLFGASGQRSANAANLRIARENREWQTQMSNTAYQRAARDLEAAGLNRILALGSPASTPAGNIATMQNENAELARGLTEATGKGIQAATAKENIKLMRQQRDLVKAQEAVAKEERWKKITEDYNIKAENVRRNLDNTIRMMELEIYKKYPWLMESNMLLGGNAAQATFNTAKGAMGMLKKAQDARKTLTRETTRFGPRGEYRGGTVTTTGGK